MVLNQWNLFTFLYILFAVVEPPELSTFDYVADYMVTPEDGKKEKEKKDEKPLIGVHMLLVLAFIIIIE